MTSTSFRRPPLIRSFYVGTYPNGYSIETEEWIRRKLDGEIFQDYGRLPRHAFSSYANLPGGFDYWRAKTWDNLTEEDKDFFRWTIRKGRIYDSPSKEKF